MSVYEIISICVLFYISFVFFRSSSLVVKMEKELLEIKEYVSKLEDEVLENGKINCTMNVYHHYHEHFINKNDFRPAIYINGIYYINFINALRRLDEEKDVMNKYYYLNICGLNSDGKVVISNGYYDTYKEILEYVSEIEKIRNNTKKELKVDGYVYNFCPKDEKYMQILSEANYLMYLLNQQYVEDDDLFSNWKTREDYKYIKSLSNIHTDFDNEDYYYVGPNNYVDVCKEKFGNLRPNISPEEILSNYRKDFNEIFSL